MNIHQNRMNIHQITESYHVIDRRDGERVAGGFGTLEAAEAWIEKTDRRGSGEFEARETAKPAAIECRRCGLTATTHLEYRDEDRRESWPNQTTDRCDRCAGLLREHAAWTAASPTQTTITILVDRPLEEQA